MSGTFTITVGKNELNALIKMVHHSLDNTSNKKQRKMLGLLYDELAATLDMDFLAVANNNLQNLETMVEQVTKEAKRKHLKVIK